MNRKVYTTALIVFLVLMMINVDATIASEPGYERFEYQTVVEPTIDGVWSYSNEWTDCAPTMIGENVVFRSKFTLIPEPLVVHSHFLIEFLTDNTDDTGDYWQICIDGELNGGSAPQTDDFRIDIAGHTSIVYQGTGSGWAQVTPDPSDLSFADSINQSPTSGNPHRILEISILKTSGIITMGTIWGIRLGVYDASNSGAGVQAWPPTDRDTPDDWGIENYTQEPYNPTTVATPTFSPEPGTYSSPQYVSISCVTSGATIRYTTDGTDPTSVSPVYTNPILMGTGSGTIKARAFKSGLTDSDVATGTYNIQQGAEQVATPVLTPEAGIYTWNVTVEISCSTVGATIHYTLDGSTPNETSPVYSDPILVTDIFLNIQAMAVKSGWIDSNVSSVWYFITSDEQVATPTFDPEPGTYYSPISVSIFCDTVNSTIGYTTNGSDPVPGVPVYESPISVDSGSVTVKAKAWKLGLIPSEIGSATYTVLNMVATPTFSLTPGTYSSAQSVSLFCSTSGAEIHYTTDGSTPSIYSPVYSGSISVDSGSVTIKAMAFKTGMTHSDMSSATYTIQSTSDQVATPTFNLAPGTYSSAQSVSISCSTIGATIRYTTNGEEPTSSSSVYSAPVSVSSGSVTIKAKAFKSGMSDSYVASATYTIHSNVDQVAMPTFSLAPGTYSSAQSVSISCSTSGATIRYTTDGADPTSSSSVYSAPVSVTSGSVTIKAKAFKSGMSDSYVASATYTIQSTSDQVATPTFSLAPGTYSSSQSISLFCSTSGATIRYTLDGSTPNSSSTVYYGPVSVTDGSVTIKAMAFKNGLTESNVASGTYSIVPDQVATPTFSLSPGNYSSSRSVSLFCSTSGATIRYTLDGSTPNSSSTLYSSPISVTNGDVTIKARAFRTGLADSEVASGTYSIVSDGVESNQLDLSIEDIAAIISVIALSVGAGGWIFRRYSARKKHKILFTKLMEDIDTIYTRYKMNTLRCETELHKSKNQVLEDFKQGLIDEEKYNMLNARIDNYLTEVEEKKSQERQL